MSFLLFNILKTFFFNLCHFLKLILVLRIFWLFILSIIDFLKAMHMCSIKNFDYRSNFTIIHMIYNSNFLFNSIYYHLSNLLISWLMRVFRIFLSHFYNKNCSINMIIFKSNIFGGWICSLWIKSKIFF